MKRIFILVSRSFHNVSTGIAKFAIPRVQRERNIEKIVTEAS